MHRVSAGRRIDEHPVPITGQLAGFARRIAMATFPKD
jgi:hypothetical protein